MTRTYPIFSCLLDEDVEALKGKFLDERDYDLLVGYEDADVLKPDGTPLLMLRQQVISSEVLMAAYKPLRRAARPTMNSKAAPGGRFHRIKRDGTRSNVNEANQVRSGYAGFVDRTQREPFCRATAYTRDDVEGWKEIKRFVREVDAVFQSECPERYAAQMEVASQTDAAWIIPGTAFTTVTVNRNFRTTTHKDGGDLPEGFGVMTVAHAEGYDGFYLCFPKYRVAVDMRPGDVLLADVHEYHGNTPYTETADDWERISTVMYYRYRMRKCGTPEQELEQAKLRQAGDPLYAP